MPASFAALSFQNGNGFTTSALTEGAQRSQSFSLSVDGPTGQIGLAVANPSRGDAQVAVEFVASDSSRIAMATLSVPGERQIAVSLNQIQGWQIPDAVSGTLRLVSTVPLSVSGFKIIYNDRGDLLVAALPAIYPETVRGNLIWARLSDEWSHFVRLTLFNGSSQVASGVLTPYSTTGRTLPLAFR